VRGLAFIINIVTLIPAFVLAWMAFTSAMSAIQRGRSQHWYRCVFCLCGATACFELGTFLLTVAT